MSQALRVLIVEKNNEYRCFLSKVIRGIDESIEIADPVAHGINAAASLQKSPADLVLLQVEAPLAESVKVLEKLRQAYPETGVIAMSASGAENSLDAAKAAQLGALDFICGFGADLGEDAALSLRRRLMTLLGLCRARRNSRLARQLRQEHTAVQDVAPKGQCPILQHGMIARTTLEPPKRSPKSCPTNHRIELVAIGVSTGGPNALADLVPLLPSDLGIPLLIVQHMPAIMTASLAESLNKKSALEVREAVDGEQVLPNIAYVASGGRHMTVASEWTNTGLSSRKHIQLTRDPPVNSCRPSVDVLFYSLAQAYSGRVLAVIMTGMGSDGTEGIRALKKNNCYCMSQTEATCVVYGMPRAVVEAGLSDERVPLGNMAFRILELVRGQNQKGESR